MNWLTQMRRRFRIKRRIVQRPDFLASQKPASIGIEISSSFNEQPLDETHVSHIFKQLAIAISEFGELPVFIHANKNMDMPILVSLIRFAHRLECPPHLIGNGPTITKEQAESFVLAGLVSYACDIASFDEDAHHSVVSMPLEDTLKCVEALHNASKELVRPLHLIARIPWHKNSADKSVATFEKLKDGHFDEIVLVPTLRGGDLANNPNELQYFKELDNPKHKTSKHVLNYLSQSPENDSEPGRKDNTNNCRVLQQRRVYQIDGLQHACPFQPEKPKWEDSISEHALLIRSCQRACVHTDLFPYANDSLFD